MIRSSMRKPVFVLICGVAVVAFLALLNHFGTLFKTDDDWRSLLRDFVANGFGAFLGVTFAFWADHVTKRNEVTSRRLALLMSLEISFSRNAALLAEMLRQLTSRFYGAPSFLAEVGSLEGMNVVKAEILEVSPLRSKVEEAQFELLHVNRKLELLLTVVLPSLGEDSTVPMTYPDKTRLLSLLPDIESVDPLRQLIVDRSYFPNAISKYVGNAGATISLIDSARKRCLEVAHDLRAEIKRSGGSSSSDI